MKKFIVISGASGSGKDTIVNKLIKRDQFVKFISTTSRKKRIKEIDGVDYNFITDSEFKKGIQQGKFLEYAEFNNNYYGKQTKELKKVLEEELNIITILEKEGVKAIREYKDMLLIKGYKLQIIFLDISEAIIRERMIKRGDKMEDIEKRLKNADFTYFQDIKNYADIIINADVVEEEIYKQIKQNILL